MLCRNCNHILMGNENFCPNCGMVPLPMPPEYEGVPNEAKSSSESTASPPQMFKSEKGERLSAAKENPIFTVEDMCDDDECEKTQHKGSVAGKIMLTLFFTCAMTAAAFVAADYFNLTESVSGFLSGTSSVTNGDIQSAQSVSPDIGIIKPEVNYSPCAAYVACAQGLTLRKGPGDGYAPLVLLPLSSQVKIFGGSLTDSNWVYVYCPDINSYGWLNSSYLGTQHRS